MKCAITCIPVETCSVGEAMSGSVVVATGIFVSGASDSSCGERGLEGWSLVTCPDPAPHPAACVSCTNTRDVDREVELDILHLNQTFVMQMNYNRLPMRAFKYGIS